MSDTVTTLAGKLRPHWLRDLGASNGASGSGGGGGGAMTAHALNGPYHTGTIDPSQAPWAVPNTRTLTAGNGLEGGGDLSADRSFALASTVAGAGLTFTAGVIDVAVSGLGLSVGANLLTLTSSSNPGQAASILATGTNGEVTLRNAFFGQAAQSSAVFASGWAGSGWRADYGITTASRASIETDDLTVRGRMRVYELLIQQIRATNGSVVVTSSSKVVDATASVNPLWLVNGVQLTFNGANANFSTTIYGIVTAAAGDTSRELYHGFLYGDVIRAQQVEWDGAEFNGVIQSDLEVVGVADLFTYFATLVSGDAPVTGYDYVRLGNVIDSSRQGLVYLTSDDSAAPFIDIVDGVRYHSDFNSASTHRVRVGKLSGISDSAFGGTLSGYGLYGNNVYLRGQIVVTGGDLGGLAAADVNTNTTTISGGKITANSITAAQIAAGTITANEIAAGTITTTQLNFTPVASTNVIASINASPETGVTINGVKLTINSSTTFASGYNPTTKIATGGASADVNDNLVTTINGGRITANSITGAQFDAQSYIAINDSTFENAGVQLQWNSGQPRFYVGDGENAFIKFDYTEDDDAYASMSGALIEGACYVTGSVYAGNGNIRISTDGQRLKLPTTSGVDVPTDSSAVRWLGITNLADSFTIADNYTGMIGYRNTTHNVVDMQVTSVVGNSYDHNHAARVVLQAGRYDDSGVFDGTYLLVNRNWTGTLKEIYAECTTFYVTGDVGCANVVDHTPDFAGDAVAELRGVRGDGRGKIDHDTLPEQARKPLYNSVSKSTVPGRDLSMMVSILTRAVQQLDARLDAIEKRGR